MPSPKLSPVQAEVLARLTNEWQLRYVLIFGHRRDATLTALVKKGYAERRWQFGHYEPEYRLAQKGNADA